MVSFPNGKINLGLHVTGKRPDGFHNIETVFYPVAIHDVVEIVADEKLSFQFAGVGVAGAAEDNLCLKAYKLLKFHHPQLLPVSIYLYKNIPVGAGLGGGSADAVACLKLLNSVGKLHLSDNQLSEYALQLGSDCPFFLINAPCFASGQGEILQRIHIDFSGYDILIVNPGIHVNTGWAFAALEAFSKPEELHPIVSQPLDQWRSVLRNDFEMVVHVKYPETKRLKEMMYAAGAIYSSLSGTGSTVYGIFKKGERPDLPLPQSYFVKWL